MGYFKDIQELASSSVVMEGRAIFPLSGETDIADNADAEFYARYSDDVEFGEREYVGEAHEEVSFKEDGTRVTSFVLDSGGVVATAEERETTEDGHRVVYADVKISGDYLPESRWDSFEGRDGESLSVRKEYDESGRIVSISENGDERRIEYREDGSVERVSEIHPLGGDLEGFTDRTVTDYNEKGNPVSAETFRHDGIQDGDVQVSYGRTDYTYDSIGFISSKTETHSEGVAGDGKDSADSTRWTSGTTNEDRYNSGVLIGREGSSFQEDGTKIKLSVEGYDNGILKQSVKETTDKDGNVSTESETRDKEGRPLSREEREIDSSTGKISTTLFEYKYDTEGRLSEYTYVDSTDSSGRMEYLGAESDRYESVTTYTDKPDGTFTDSTVDKETHTDKNITKEFTFDTDGRRSQTVTISDKDGNEKFKIEKTQNEDGTITKTVSEDGKVKSVDTIAPGERSDRTFSVDGSEEREDGGTKEMLTSYDEDGNPVSCEVSYYDANGNLEATESVTFDGDGGFDAVTRDADGVEIKHVSVEGGEALSDITAPDEQAEIDVSDISSDEDFLSGIDDMVADICEDAGSDIGIDENDGIDDYTDDVSDGDIDGDTDGGTDFDGDDIESDFDDSSSWNDDFTD